jgi:outer membrane protein TolC
MAMPSMVDAFTARVGFSWPNAPWARHRVDEMLKGADAAIVAATAQRESVTVRIREAVAGQLVKAQAAERRRSLLATSVIPALRHALEIARIDYAAGRSAFTPLFELTRRLNEAALDVIRVRADRDRALTTLDVLAGDLMGQSHRESR